MALTVVKRVSAKKSFAFPGNFIWNRLGETKRYLVKYISSTRRYILITKQGRFIPHFLLTLLYFYCNRFRVFYSANSCMISNLESSSSSKNDLANVPRDPNHKPYYELNPISMKKIYQSKMWRAIVFLLRSIIDWARKHAAAAKVLDESGNRRRSLKHLLTCVEAGIMTERNANFSLTAKPIHILVPSLSEDGKTGLRFSPFIQFTHRP